MKKVAILSAVMVITACSMTPDKLRSSKPDFQVSSSKSSEQLSMCISEGWENTTVLGGSPIVSYRPTTSGHTVSLVIGGNLSHLADIENTEQGSKITVYSNTIALGQDPSLSVVLDCQS